MIRSRTNRCWRRDNSPALRLAFALALVCVAAVHAAGQEAMYSDEWSYETPDCEHCMPEATQTYISGVGVTEDDYNSYSSYRVEAYLRSPSGHSVSSVAYGDASTRADVSMAVNIVSPEEGDYTVNSYHSETPYEPWNTGMQSSFTHTGFSSVVGSLRIAKVRYSLQRSFQDPYYWLYGKDCNSAICRNTAQARWLSKSANPYPPQYINYYGVRFTVYFFTWCAYVTWPSNFGENCV